jgi:hypothetical protein
MWRQRWNGSMMPDPEFPPPWAHHWAVFAPLARRLQADRQAGDARQVEAGHLSAQDAADRQGIAADIAMVWDSVCAGRLPAETVYPASVIAADLATAITRIESHQQRHGPPPAEDEDFLDCMKALWWWMRPWPSGSAHIVELARQGMAQPGRWLIHPFYTAQQRNAA